ncbi:MAG: 2-dehydro-3-deoxygluconokinase [Chlamydiae bacterium]|nr:2-dehydro-3-deoxygluconokinase [Chlamydiota bacterium]
MKCLLICLCFIGFSFPIYCHEVVSYGNAIVDYITFVDEKILSSIEGEKGGMNPVDLKTFQTLTKDAEIIQAGGSAPNTLKGLALLGHDCGIIGRIGDCPQSEFYIKNLKEYGVSPHFAEFTGPVGRVVCMITPDGERTMRTHLGDLITFPDFTFEPSIFDDAKIFHVEGYQLPSLSFLHKIISIAKEKDTVISMDLGCFELVREFKEPLLSLLEEKIDILFCNREESLELTGLPPQEAAKKLSEICRIVVVTDGAQGGYIATKKKTLSFRAQQAQLVDATGAGDLFIAGFLHGLLEKQPLEACAESGATIAAKIVSIIGAEIPRNWSGKQNLVLSKKSVHKEMAPDSSAR